MPDANWNWNKTEAQDPVHSQFLSYLYVPQ